MIYSTSTDATRAAQVFSEFKNRAQDFVPAGYETSEAARMLCSDKIQAKNDSTTTDTVAAMLGMRLEHGREFRDINTPGNDYQRRVLDDMQISSAAVLVKGPAIIEVTKSYIGTGEETRCLIANDGVMLSRCPGSTGIQITDIAKFLEDGTAVSLRGEFSVAFNPQRPSPYYQVSLRGRLAEIADLGKNLDVIQFTSQGGGLTVRILTHKDNPITSGHTYDLHDPLQPQGLKHLGVTEIGPNDIDSQDTRSVLKANASVLGNAWEAMVRPEKAHSRDLMIALSSDHSTKMVNAIHLITGESPELVDSVLTELRKLHPNLEIMNRELVTRESVSINVKSIGISSPGQFHKVLDAITTAVDNAWFAKMRS